jgi:hypothetical protein
MKLSLMKLVTMLLATGWLVRRPTPAPALARVKADDPVARLRCAGF